MKKSLITKHNKKQRKKPGISINKTLQILNEINLSILNEEFNLNIKHKDTEFNNSIIKNLYIIKIKI